MRLSGSRNFKRATGTAFLAGCMVVSAGQIVAAPRPASLGQAGLVPPTRVETALDANAAVLAREVKTRDSLGFPVGVTRVGRHVRDGFSHAEYDEVTEFDSAGRVQTISQFDSKGLLLTAVRLDLPPGVNSTVSRDGAARTAQQSALAAGLGVGTPTSTEADEATGGWTIHWARSQAGIRVRGDETRVRVWADGRIQSVARVEHDLPPSPVRRIGSDAARRVASANLASWSAGRNSQYAIQKVDLEWVEPNAAFDPAGINAAEVPYRLAWVTEAKPSGDSASYVWLMTIFVDAADGTIIGGDFVE